MCAICDFRIELAVEHPRTFAVAVSTRAAIEAGVLADPGPAKARRRLRIQAVSALKALQQRLEAALSRDRLAALPCFYALAVESHTWGFFLPTPDGFDANHRPEPPRVSAALPGERDAVVLTSQVALEQLLAQRLAFDEALERQLVVIDAEQGREGAITEALRLALGRPGPGRWVCS